MPCVFKESEEIGQAEEKRIDRPKIIYNGLKMFKKSYPSGKKIQEIEMLLV